jgi:hypothetical protein
MRRGIADHAFVFGQLRVQIERIGPVKSCHFGHRLSPIDGRSLDFLCSFHKFPLIVSTRTCFAIHSAAMADIAGGYDRHRNDAKENAVSLQHEVENLLNGLRVAAHGLQPVHSPIDGSQVATYAQATPMEVETAIAQSGTAFQAWRTVPAPRRGELVRRFGNALREHKADLARLVTIECGKPMSEGEGEVQEMIDICDFAVGLVAATARADHRQRTTRSPDDGAMASAGSDADHQRVQLSGCGLGMECRAGAGVRQQR